MIGQDNISWFVALSVLFGDVQFYCPTTLGELVIDRLEWGCLTSFIGAEMCIFSDEQYS